MIQCVYCLKELIESEFKSEEHIIPQCLGGKPFPTLRNIVCNYCNGNIFSKLETELKQDSLEGVFSQMIGISRWSNTVWIKGKRLEMDTVTGLGSDFYNHAFPFIKFVDTEIVFDFKSQLKVKNKRIGYQVYPIEYLKHLEKRKNHEFRKLKDSRLKNISMNDMRIFTNTSQEIDEIIELLKTYGINYTEKQREYSITQIQRNSEVEINWIYNWDKIIQRALTKIAFNYFIHCNLSEGDFYKNLLYHQNFNNIRNFVVEGKGNPSNFIKKIDSESIVDLEKGTGKRIIAHTIYFYINPVGEVISRISLFGSYIYEINLGMYPITLNTNSIGCGNIFDPFLKEVGSLTPKRAFKNAKSKSLYGLFQI